MRIGRLRHRIEIQQATETRNNYGEPVVSWATFRKCWASVEPLRGRELWAALEQQARVSTRIRIRYLADVTPKTRILYATRIYLINSIIDEEERHINMQLMCEEVVKT